MWFRSWGQGRNSHYIPPQYSHCPYLLHGQELVDRAQGGSSRWEDIYDEVAAKEMEIFNALADGSALEQVRGVKGLGQGQGSGGHY